MSRALAFVGTVGGALGLAVAACGEGASRTPSGTPIADLVAAGKAPVVVLGVHRSMGPVPAFRCRVRNLSDRKVTAVSWTTVFRTADGKPLGTPVEGGYADSISPIGPGDEIEGAFPAPDDAASEAVVVVRRVLYDAPNPMGEAFGSLTMKWDNPGHDADVAAAAGKP